MADLILDASLSVYVIISNSCTLEKQWFQKRALVTFYISSNVQGFETKSFIKWSF